LRKRTRGAAFVSGQHGIVVTITPAKTARTLSPPRCADASFPERHKYLARYPADFCHPLQPNLMQSNTVTPMQHNWRGGARLTDA
jgi:hypothetical protein